MREVPWLVPLGLGVLLAGCGAPGPVDFDDGVTTTSPGSTSSTTTTTTTTTEPDPTTTGSTETGTDPSTSAPFIPDDDYPNPDECDSFLQDCPEGEKCVPYGSTGGNWDAHKCVEVMGDQAPGEPCVYGGTAEATDDCDETSGCWDVMDVDGEAIGTCHAFCAGTADDPMCPPGSSCLVSTTIAYCIFTCDPLLQDCDPGLACYWSNSDFNCIFTTQDIPIGEPCGFVNDCEGGLVCTNADVLPGCGGSACCTKFCDIFAPGQCGELPGTECLTFFPEDSAPPGYEHIGVCMIPEDPNP